MSIYLGWSLRLRHSDAGVVVLGWGGTVADQNMSIYSTDGCDVQLLSMVSGANLSTPIIFITSFACLQFNSTNRDVVWLLFGRLVCLILTQ